MSLDATRSAEKYARNNQDTFIDDLFEILSQPSISTKNKGIDECLNIICELTKRYGCQEQHIIETEGHPALIAKWTTDDSSSHNFPTILMYGHYDVQPADGGEWSSAPFDPEIREGPNGDPRIYARGAGDNKGQWFAHLCAIKSYLKTSTLPVNVTLILEGEEENGSPNIEEIIQRSTDKLDADVFYMADGPIDPSGKPHVFLGSRGMVYAQIDIQGPKSDLHSGNFGGPIPNPAWGAVNLLSSLKDNNGKVTIDGFYGNVRGISEAQREIVENIPFNERKMKRDLGIPVFTESPGESYWEKIMCYPTLNIAGISSGYSGKGKKTIIPSTAQIKIDMRLVPDQKPDVIFEKFQNHIKSHISEEYTVNVSRLSSTGAHRTPIDSPYCQPILDGVESGWGVEPILKPSIGASGPDDAFARILDIPCFIIPYANSDENNHGPNENLAVDCFTKGIKTTIHVMNSISNEMK